MPPHVLLIEDDEDLRTATGELLSAAGYLVSAAATEAGAYAALAAARRRPDLIILDLLLEPGSSGRDIAHSIRSGPLASVPIVFFTGASNVSELAAEVVLRKPASLEDLLAVVERALAKGS